jgi:hypothetical protein
MSDIIKKEKLGGKETLEGEDRDYSPEATKKTLEELGLKPVEDVEIENPITGKKSIVTIDREGTHDVKLIQALADKNLTRDQKDGVISMYLFERGKENASFIAELFRYKGQHTKETRAFTSQMRFDFEMFIGMQTQQMRAKARDVFDSYNIKDPEQFCKAYLNKLKEDKNYSAKQCYVDTIISFYEMSFTDSIILKSAIRDWTEADRFEERMNKITESREREQGKGIYLDLDGKPYSIYQDNEVDEVVKKDITRLRDLEKNDRI